MRPEGVKIDDNNEAIMLKAELKIDTQTLCNGKIIYLRLPRKKKKNNNNVLHGMAWHAACTNKCTNF